MDPINSVLNDTNATAAATSEATPAGLFLSSVALFLMALGPIFFGSLRSRETKDKNLLETVSFQHAAVFPLYASCALFGLFIVFKIIPTYYINLLVNMYFSLIGAGVMSRLFSPMLRWLVPQTLTNHLFKVEFSKSGEKKKDDGSTEWNLIDSDSIAFETRDIPGILVAVAIGVWYFTTYHWVASNCVSYSLALLAIEYIRLDKFINACVLLGGLFIYDIFWVFGTPVMVTVAKSLKAPITMSFPRDFLVHGFFGKEMAILGLGDIVVPGIFIALLLRFDVSLQRKDSKLYFLTGYVAYVIGLLTTFIVMHVFKAAQPALLYLVPACLGSTLLLACIKGDLKAMFEYRDTPEEPESTGTANATEPKSGQKEQSATAGNSKSRSKTTKVN